MRRAPWRSVNLKNAIYAVDKAGYNAINHMGLLFRPIDNSYSTKQDPEKYFKFFEFGYHPATFIQIKTWKNTNQPISLAASGGHKVKFQGRRVYPYNFLQKHYPILSQQHGERKIFQERKARYDPDERKDGWHVHYDHLKKSDDFNWSEDKLNRFDETFYEDFLVELISGVGIRR